MTNNACTLSTSHSSGGKKLEMKHAHKMMRKQTNQIDEKSNFPCLSFRKQNYSYYANNVKTPAEQNDTRKEKYKSGANRIHPCFFCLRFTNALKFFGEIFAACVRVLNVRKFLVFISGKMFCIFFAYDIFLRYMLDIVQ